jgi:hypothetical protein
MRSLGGTASVRTMPGSVVAVTETRGAFYKRPLCQTIRPAVISSLSPPHRKASRIGPLSPRLSGTSLALSDPTRPNQEATAGHSAAWVGGKPTPRSSPSAGSAHVRGRPQPPEAGLCGALAELDVLAALLPSLSFPPCKSRTPLRATRSPACGSLQFHYVVSRRGRAGSQRTTLPRSHDRYS